MKKWKAIGTLVLAIALSSLVSSCNQGEKAFSISNLSITFRRDVDNAPTTLDGFKYDEAWFDEDPYTYNGDLSFMSLGLMFSGFDNLKYDTVSKTGDMYAKRLYGALGFDENTYCSVGYDESDDDSVAMTMDTKQIKTSLSDNTTLLSIVFRSGCYGDGGWQGNFDIGPGEETVEGKDNEQYHLGFYKGAVFAIENIKKYIAEHAISLDSTKFWLTGYSRGAAIANIVSILLSEDVKAPRSNIYTYAGATPNYEIVKELSPEYKNIHNLRNSGDIVTMMPPKQWGFGLEGNIVPLPMATTDNAKKFKETFEKIAGVEYEGTSYDFSEVSTYMVSLLTKHFGDRKGYYEQLQPLIISLLAHDENGDLDYSYADNILTCEGKNEDMKVEKIIEDLKSIDPNDSSALSNLFSSVSEGFDEATTYWNEKGSPNGELLNNIKGLTDELITVFKNSIKPGNQNSLDAKAIDALTEMVNKGAIAPMILQHWPELYLSHIIASKN